MILKRNSKLVFSFDDAVHLGHQDVGNHKYPLVYKLKYGPGINAILTECTHVIAGSQTLANHALQFNPHVTVIPTVVDLERYPIGPPRRPDGAITIGWVGSRSTSPYLLELESVLQRLSRAHPGKLRFRLYGDAKRHLDLPRSESFPFRLATEIEDLRSLDIGLMPIPDNGWTRGKCAFKAIQYMALGIPVVASPVGMAAEVVKHNVNGFLARTAEEWFAALDKLVREADLRERLGASGRATVEERYSLQRWGPVFARLLRDVVECRQPQTVGRHALTTV
jgi:glycosyltransferase involved in cell wall biosynthesis